MKVIGWLLDAHVNDDKAILWLKLQDGRSLRVADSYKPDFYAESNEKDQPEQVAGLLSSHPGIDHVTLEQKLTSLSATKRTSLMHVHVDSTRDFDRVLRDIQRLGLIKRYYNTDLWHVQRYLFNKRVAPTRKVQAECDESNRLVDLKLLDDSLEIEPPPFTSLFFEVGIRNACLNPKVEEDPISKIAVWNGGRKRRKTFEGEEIEILSRFADYVDKKDPDLLVSRQAAASLRYVLQRALLLRLNVELGREEVNIFDLRNLLPYAHKGRICVDLDIFLNLGIAGLTEKARFAVAPIGLSATWSPGRLIDSRQCYEALRRGVLLPETGGNFQATTARDVIFRDRGGLILSPKTGLHENVAELDYESMYPHIIVRNNISYETASIHSIDKTRKGFLAEITERFLERRLFFKHSKKLYAENSQQWLYCEQRQQALKRLLVCMYGYSGCFANRFNNVAAYEEVNRIARETLVNTINIAMEAGFEVIYADSDSVFVKRKDARTEDYEDLAESIGRRVGFPMALDRHYKFLVLLAQEADPSLEATRRYYGKLVGGKLHYRGIELRRHDCPILVKRFQKRLSEILLDAETADNVDGNQFKKAYDYVVEICDSVLAGDLEAEDLVVSKVLKKPISTYKSVFPHVAAAIQLLQKGKQVKTGESINFLYVNAAHTDPLKRVIPAALKGSHSCYDREKYLELVLDAAETILSPFGFSRKQLGFNTRSRDYLEEIVSEREQEILSEIQNLSAVNSWARNLARA